jgi:hypothetical protein
MYCLDDEVPDMAAENAKTQEETAVGVEEPELNIPANCPVLSDNIPAVQQTAKERNDRPKLNRPKLDRPKGTGQVDRPGPATTG